MVVRQVSVPKPAAGHDWQFVVPAQWLPYLYGVTATLTTPAGLTTAADSSGNARPLTLATTADAPTFGQPGPFSGAGNNCAFLGTPTVTSNGIGTSGSFAAFAAVAFTLECLLKSSAFTGAESQSCVMASFGAATLNASGNLNNNNAANRQGFTSAGGGSSNLLNNVLPRSAWHHWAVTQSAGTWNGYLDGVLVGAYGAAPAAGVTSPAAITVGDLGLSGRRYDGYMSAAAYYSSALPAANLLAHVNALTTKAAYKAAVLADTPEALWMLDDTGAMGSRIVTLKVTDGTNLVAQFPASFASVILSGAIWSWQALGPGAQSSTDGTVNSVPIPEIQVDAGYVISTVTLDLQPTDQWGPITVWFDDGTGPAGGPLPGGGTSYLNALLVPDYANRGG